MDSRIVPLDQEVFTRASALFDSKLKVLPAHLVEGFARQIVARMARAPALIAQIDETGIHSEDVEDFCDLLLSSTQAEAALSFIRARRAEGVTARGIYLGFITEAARLLGERFERDELTPLDVTMAAGNLYALLRALQGRPQAAGEQPRAALFATVPGEEHGLGITVAAHMFREAGWDIDLKIGLNEGELIDHVERMQPKVIGLSLSTRLRLPDLLHLLMTLRIVAPRAVIGVAPGGDLSAAELDGLADVDLLFTDAATALGDLDALLSPADQRAAQSSSRA